MSIKENVKSYYGDIAKKVSEKGAGGCGCSSSCCDEMSSSLYDVEKLKSLPKEAINASLGCGDPLLFAQIEEGETVLDLGSGGGIDVLLAAKYVGETGKVYGLDMTDEMLNLANKNKEKMGVTNVEFLKGFIEDIPLENESIDVIMSNCVINLSEDKEKALAEAYRVLKKGGRLAIADVVSLKEVPEGIKRSAELWAGCIAGTISVEAYQKILEKVGFTRIEINPLHVYSKGVIEDIISRKKLQLEDIFDYGTLEVIDGAFAGAYIKAFK